MSIDLSDYQAKVKEAVKAFWGNREAARQKQIESGKIDQGERAWVTTGKNMDGFFALVKGYRGLEWTRSGRHPLEEAVTHASRVFPSHKIVGYARDK